MATNVNTLTKAERLILFNQMQIRAVLQPDNKDYFQRMATILTEGYTLDYSQLFNPVYDELSNSQCAYVIEVMDMFSAMQISFNKLEDKDGITEDSLVFPGFNGNSETALMGYAEFVKDELGKFA